MENKLVIFDLDGVLIESKMMHYHVLNLALEKIDRKYVIEYQDHVENYNGLPTLKKLEQLTLTKQLPVEHYKFIQDEKQSATIEWVKDLKLDQELVDMFKRIKANNTIAVASNSIRATVEQSLVSLGLIEFVDYYISNQDVKNPKPDPEMFLRCMEELNFSAKDTIIIEDSPVGIQAAISSGATLITVTGPEDLKNKL